MVIAGFRVSKFLATSVFITPQRWPPFTLGGGHIFMGFFWETSGHFCLAASDGFFRQAEIKPSRLLKHRNGQGTILQLSSDQNPWLTFHSTGWLMGILIIPTELGSIIPYVTSPTGLLITAHSHFLRSLPRRMNKKTRKNGWTRGC